MGQPGLGNERITYIYSVSLDRLDHWLRKWIAETKDQPRQDAQSQERFADTGRG
jgi:hypothetical protein